jgi:HSP20 family molecular chaperone IbpA
VVDQRDVSAYQRFAVREDFDEFAVHVERLWSQLRRGSLQQPHYNPSFVRPAIDVYQTGDRVVVVIEAPGMRNRQLHLELEGNRLTISGEKQGRSCAKDGLYSQLEIACGPFSRTIELPCEVDAENISLDYDDGYIEIRLPRIQRPLERRVRITLRQV